MIIINCEPIQGDITTYDNVILKDDRGYPYALVYVDLFNDIKDKSIVDKIREGKEFQLQVKVLS